MLTALALSIGQLGDRRILRVLAKSIAVTLILFALFGVGVWWGTRAALDMWAGGSSDALAAAVAVVTTALALWLAFRAVGIAVIGVFADEVVGAVEAQHYPAALASAREVGFAGSTMMGLRSAVRVVAVNAALLPVYIVLLATGVGTAAAFFIVNGWLLGRDLGDMVAARHRPVSTMRDWRKATRWSRFALGLVATGLFVVPLVNILAPIIGAAMATHLYHRGKA
jgi:CysZ protein